jgi:hypothetical protein
MKKVVLFSVLLLLLSGCYTYYDANPPTVTEPTTSTPPTYYYNSSGNDASVGSTIVYPLTTPQDAKSIESRMMDVNWISPGKVTIENLYKGAQAEYTLRIHNGGRVSTIFQVIPRQPDGIRSDKLPYDCMDWVQIPQLAIYVPAKTTYEMPITVKMLKDIDMKGKTYEFWISVIDNGQKGMVQTELCSRWIISTRK